MFKNYSDMISLSIKSLWGLDDLKNSFVRFFIEVDFLKLLHVRLRELSAVEDKDTETTLKRHALKFLFDAIRGMGDKTYLHAELFESSCKSFKHANWQSPKRATSGMNEIIYKENRQMSISSHIKENQKHFRLDNPLRQMGKKDKAYLSKSAPC